MGDRPNLLWAQPTVIIVMHVKRCLKNFLNKHNVFDKFGTRELCFKKRHVMGKNFTNLNRFWWFLLQKYYLHNHILFFVCLGVRVCVLKMVPSRHLLSNTKLDASYPFPSIPPKMKGKAGKSTFVLWKIINNAWDVVNSSKTKCISLYTKKKSF